MKLVCQKCGIEFDAIPMPALGNGKLMRLYLASDQQQPRILQGFANVDYARCPGMCKGELVTAAQAYE